MTVRSVPEMMVFLSSKHHDWAWDVEHRSLIDESIYISAKHTVCEHSDSHEVTARFLEEAAMPYDSIIDAFERRISRHKCWYNHMFMAVKTDPIISSLDQTCTKLEYAEQMADAWMRVAKRVRDGEDF